jgi:phage terminase small subunit
MPRASAEARAAARHRAGGGEPPGPPEWLTEAAAGIWRAICAAKPADWFDAGNRPLLAAYCATLARLRDLHVALAAMPVDAKGAAFMEQRVQGMAGSAVMLATKLRLTVQAAVRRDAGILAEKGPGEGVADDPLLGGKVVPIGRGRRD